MVSSVGDSDPLLSVGTVENSVKLCHATNRTVSVTESGRENITRRRASKMASWKKCWASSCGSPVSLPPGCACWRNRLFINVVEFNICVESLKPD